MKRRLLFAVLALVTSLVGLGGFERNAHAIIGRPLTPLSFAGVARRTTRRMVGFSGPMAMRPPGYGYGYGYGGMYGPGPMYW
jgi:hypothetical protein